MSAPEHELAHANQALIGKLLASCNGCIHSLCCVQSHDTKVKPAEQSQADRQCVDISIMRR
jgi:hypothetical protein